MNQLKCIILFFPYRNRNKARGSSAQVSRPSPAPSTVTSLPETPTPRRMPASPRQTSANFVRNTTPTPIRNESINYSFARNPPSSSSSRGRVVYTNSDSNSASLTATASRSRGGSSQVSSNSRSKSCSDSDCGRSNKPHLRYVQQKFIQTQYFLSY